MAWFNAKYEQTDTKDRTASFTQAGTRENIRSGEKHKTIFGKISRWFADLKPVAFSGSYNDLSNKPITISNSDTVDGFHASQAAGSHNTCVVTDGNGHIQANYINSNTNASENPAIGSVIVTNNTNDGYYRKATLQHLKNALGIGGVICNGLQLYDWNGNQSQNTTFGVIYLGLNNFGRIEFHCYKDHIKLSNDYDIIGILNLMIKSSYNNVINIYAAGKEITKGIVIDAYTDWGSFRPYADNMLYLGHSAQRWKQVYAVNSAISTSDRNEKENISYIGSKSSYEDTSMTDVELTMLVMGLRPVIFKRINGESGRPHHGIIAQDFEELMAEIGLHDHAAFIKSPKTEEIEVTKEDGSKEIKIQEVLGEYIYGIRYEEFIADVIRFCQILKDENSRQQKKIEDLEKRMEILENVVK